MKTAEKAAHPLREDRYLSPISWQAKSQKDPPPIRVGCLLPQFIPATGRKYGRAVSNYFFFVFFAAFGFAAAFDVVFTVGFFALRFAIIGMRE
jgi:hypothetical protein